MGRDPRETRDLDRTQQSIAPRFIAWLALGHNAVFKNAGENEARSCRRY
jgi:hypothetical protein